MPTNKLPIIALEGAPFSGKTTLIKYLKENYSDLLNLIPESGEYVGGDKNFPKIPFGNYDEAKASTHFFLNIEIKRFDDANSLYKKKNKPIVFDRVNLFSTPIFYKLLETQYSSLHSFTESFFDYSLRLFQSAIDSKSIFIPSRIIYLSVKDRTVFEGRTNRGASTNIFKSWETYEFLDYEYRKIFKSYNNILFLESFDSQSSLKDLANEIVKYAKIGSSAKLNRLDSIFRQKLESNSDFDSREEKRRYKQIYEDCNKLMRNLI